jgi:putative intracellular protease/amidase
MKPKRNGGRPDRNGVSSKDRSLEPFRERPDETALTTDQGARVHHTDDSLKAGRRGPTLLEDFHLREKITRFDHERIPERVVHARGSAAHGFFQVYESMAKLTRAGFLQDPRTRTPVPSPALSMTTTVKDTIKGRVIAALVAPGVAGRELTAARKALEAAGAKVEIVAPALGMVATADGTTLEATRSLLTVKSVLFDAVLIPGGADGVETLGRNPDARDFVDEAYKHFKPIGAMGEGVELLRAAGVGEEALATPDRRNGKPGSRLGVVIGGGSETRAFVEQFSEAVAQHRHSARAEDGRPVPEANRPRARAR